MNTSLITLPLHGKRDAVVARQRARQLAGLLGLDPPRQGWFAAAVFEMACDVRQESGRGRLHFQVANGAVRAFAECWPSAAPPADAPCVEAPLPADGSRLAAEDLAWAVSRLHDLTPLDVFEEVRRLNRELLAAYQQLRAADFCPAPDMGQREYRPHAA
jgi:hypothetical protein